MIHTLIPKVRVVMYKKQKCHLSAQLLLHHIRVICHHCRWSPNLSIHVFFPFIITCEQTTQNTQTPPLDETNQLRPRGSIPSLPRVVNFHLSPKQKLSQKWSKHVCCKTISRRWQSYLQQHIYMCTSQQKNEHTCQCSKLLSPHVSCHHINRTVLITSLA